MQSSHNEMHLSQHLTRNGQIFNKKIVIVAIYLLNITKWREKNIFSYNMNIVL